MSRMTDEEFEENVAGVSLGRRGEALLVDHRRARAREAELERQRADLARELERVIAAARAVRDRLELETGALEQVCNSPLDVDLARELAASRAALSASQERERVLAARLDRAIEIARSQGGPDEEQIAELNRLATALQSTPTPAPEPVPEGWCVACRAWKRAGIPHDCAATPAPGPSRCANCPHPYRCRAGCDLASPPAPESEREKRLARVSEAFADTAEAAVLAHESKGKGGMQVPCHGDFASAPPSVVGQLRWWVREFRAALSKSQKGER